MFLFHILHSAVAEMGFEPTTDRHSHLTKHQGVCETRLHLTFKWPKSSDRITPKIDFTFNLNDSIGPANKTHSALNSPNKQEWFVELNEFSFHEFCNEPTRKRNILASTLQD
jgi:hypothetical protein